MDFSPFYSTSSRKILSLTGLGLIAFASITHVTIAADKPNACPVDGCLATIVGIKSAGEELEVTLETNYTPDNSRNHLHMWWGEQFTSQQVGRNAKSEHSVTQGKWHRHDDYPVYITSGAVSTSVRDGATTLCVTAADRDHNVIDADLFHCMDVSSALN